MSYLEVLSRTHPLLLVLVVARLRMICSFSRTMKPKECLSCLPVWWLHGVELCCCRWFGCGPV